MKKYDEKNLYQRKFTKTLMIISSIFLAVNGVGFTFFPNEISVLLTNDDNHFSILILQILGALYLGFSYINWMSKNSLIGGIYNKPLLIGNTLHFLTASMAMIKLVFKFESCTSRTQGQSERKSGAPEGAPRGCPRRRT